MLTRRILFSFYWLNKSDLPFSINFGMCMVVFILNTIYIKRKDRAKGQENVMRKYEYFPCCKLKSFPQ